MFAGMMARPRAISSRTTFQSGEVFKSGAGLALRRHCRVLKAEVTVVFGFDRATVDLDGVAALDDPRLANRRQPLTHFATLIGVAPRSARVVNRKRWIQLGDAVHSLRRRDADLPQRHTNAGMKFAGNVDALAGRKRGVEVSGILELEP